jgi:TRAP-type uncharacterized transport system substrate-binding protein
MDRWSRRGAPGGRAIRLATEIARVVDDGDNLHVLPVVTRGATENVNSLLNLRGIDAAIINSDALQGTAAAYSGPLIFSRLGLEMESRHVSYFVFQNPQLRIGVRF